MAVATQSKKLCGNVTLNSYSPAFIAFVKARIDDGASNTEIQQEFDISSPTITAIRKTSLFSKRHVSAIKKGLSDGFAATAALALSSINPQKLENCSAPQLMMVAGVAYDKLRLAEGQSTANISFRDAGLAAIEGSKAAESALQEIAGALELPELPAHDA